MLNFEALCWWLLNGACFWSALSYGFGKFRYSQYKYIKLTSTDSESPKGYSVISLVIQGGLELLFCWYLNETAGFLIG